MLLGLVLAVCLAGWYLTRGPGNTKTRPISESSPIDQRLIETAQSMAALAETPEERDLSRETLRLADHELDQEFATALREAIVAHPPASSALKELNDRIVKIKQRIAADQQRIAKLAKTDDGQVEVAKAQLELDKDELEDAEQDLARQGGDPHAKVQAALQAHEAAQHQQSQAVHFPNPAPTRTLSQQTAAWFELGSHERQLFAAEQQARAEAASLERAHDRLEGKVAGTAPAAPDDEEETAVIVAQLQHLSDQRKNLTELDRRVQDCRQIADAYRNWGVIVVTQRRTVAHLLLSSLAIIFAILLAAVLVNHTARRAIRKQTDRRRAHQLRAVVEVSTFSAAAVAVLFLIFGWPTQLATIVGLATAGLTVVLKDFIVAFIGWFALMGRNGVRVGDFVEINGVGGEVIEVGLLRTVLLEMGNWTVKGHPTGRRVAFMNGYALEGHYFNFSTAGQWLWDELIVSLPAGADPYRMSQQIRDMVDHETEADAVEAERDWERVTHQYGMRAFSARPASEIRPSQLGLEVVVRYITRAPQRYQVKSRLFEKIVELLHNAEPASKKLDR
jgi:small-conductance mechanosensitive channel